MKIGADMKIGAWGLGLGGPDPPAGGYPLAGGGGVPQYLLSPPLYFHPRVVCPAHSYSAVQYQRSGAPISGGCLQSLDPLLDSRQGPPHLLAFVVAPVQLGQL